MGSLRQRLRDFARRSRTLVAIRRRWRAVILRDWWRTKIWRRTVEVVTPFGFKFKAGYHPAYQLMRKGLFEPEETAIIIDRLNKSDLFIDIGANVGYYTCIALQHVKSVLAFEPQSQNLSCLYHNLLVNGWEKRAEVYPVALSDTPGLLTLYGASGPSASLVRDWAGYSPYHKKTVPVLTLDSILAGRFAGQRIFVKLDVEGAEYSVLRGATETLARDPAPSWLLEVCLHEFHPGGANPDYLGIFELFWSNGYAAYTATAVPRKVTQEDVAEWIRDEKSQSGTFNYLFIKNESAEKG